MIKSVRRSIADWPLLSVKWVPPCKAYNSGYIPGRIALCRNLARFFARIGSRNSASVQFFKSLRVADFDSLLTRFGYRQAAG
jgi:hypothetical protein